MTQTFSGRSVLVTGAGGSIGSELCRLIVSDNAKRLVLVSLTEAGLYNIRRRLEQEFRKYRDTEIVGILGNAGDVKLMNEVLPGVQTVIHAGAHKHLPICEQNPLAAIENNAHVTWRLAQAAAAAHVEQFCLISSDKAVNPASIMGATKRLAELIVASTSDPVTSYFTVRFGNVMDSAGSVLPLWREQLASHQAITITDERCERYFMTIADAVDLIAKTINLRPRFGTFVLDMGKPVRLIDLAKRLIAKHAPGTPIQTIGLRPGEKVTEELHYGGELLRTGVDRLFHVSEQPRPAVDHRALRELWTSVAERRNDQAIQLLWDIVRQC